MAAKVIIREEWGFISYILVIIVGRRILKTLPVAVAALLPNLNNSGQTMNEPILEYTRNCIWNICSLKEEWCRRMRCHHKTKNPAKGRVSIEKIKVD
jgi:hypothetical protein